MAMGVGGTLKVKVICLPLGIGSFPTCTYTVYVSLSLKYT